MAVILWVGTNSTKVVRMWCFLIKCRVILNVVKDL